MEWLDALLEFSLHWVQLVPLFAYALLHERGEPQSEFWAVGLVFAVSWGADTVADITGKMFGNNWAVFVVYPIVQLAILLPLFIRGRWPRLAMPAGLMGLSIVSVVALAQLFAGLPRTPALAVLAAVSVIVLWLVWERYDLGLLRIALLVAFGGTLPGVLLLPPADALGMFDLVHLGLYKLPWTVGIALAGMAVWKVYGRPPFRVDEIETPRVTAEPAPAARGFTRLVS